MKLDVFGHTDIGNGRKQNEDNYICLHFPISSSNNRRASASHVLLAAVADGMGGHSGGEVASSMAVDILKKRVNSGRTGDSVDARNFLESTFNEANHEIFNKASRDAMLRGMGTTLVAALLIQGKSYIANVGDSRAYHIRQKNLSLITRDHTWKEDQLKKNSFSKEEINESPFKNMVTRSLGFEAGVTPDIFEEDLEEGDYLLLCSDGLHNMVSSKIFSRIFKRGKSAEWTCRKLIQTAIEKGGRDNITAVVVKVEGTLPREKKKPMLKDTIKLDPTA